MKKTAAADGSPCFSDYVSVNLKTSKDEKFTAEELADVSLDEVKKWITAQDKNAFKEKPKKKVAAKKPAAKKAPAKKAAPKKK